MQNVLSTPTRVSLTRMRVNMTLTESELYTLECDSHTQSIISTRSVISTGANVIPARTRLISTRRVQFPHADCDFTRRVWFSLTRE
jgi:hypothetical protein